MNDSPTEHKQKTHYFSDYVCMHNSPNTPHKHRLHIYMNNTPTTHKQKEHNHDVHTRMHKSPATHLCHHIRTQSNNTTQTHAGYFRQRKEEVASGCTSTGLPCPSGYTCLCRPCVKANEVDVISVPLGSEPWAFS